MSTATTTRPSPPNNWTSRSPSRPIPRTSTTPHGLPSRTPGSVGQAGSPGLSAATRSPRSHRDLRTPSPNYFEYIVDSGSNPPDSNAGGRAKKNLNPPSPGARSTAPGSPKASPLETSSKFEAFKRQSEKNKFNLGHGNLSHFGMRSGTGRSPTSRPLTDSNNNAEGASAQKIRNTDGSGGERRTPPAGRMDVDPPSSPRRIPQPSLGSGTPSFFDMPRAQSPSNASSLDFSNLKRDEISYIDERHPRNSLPHNRVDAASPGLLRSLPRSETLPECFSNDGHSMTSPEELVKLLETHPFDDFLLLDLRVYPQYSHSRISGAMNLCIPTTLLKRPSFNVQKLVDTFTKEKEKTKFSRWREAKFIVVYDASSAQLKDATSAVNTLRKFSVEGWHGTTSIIRGGFSGFSKKFPDWVDRSPVNEITDTSTKKLSIDPPTGAPVAGGCLMPNTQSAANPFFGNIRQNMDLIGGVGQMPVKLPSTMTEQATVHLPSWLKQASDERDKGKIVADRFLGIEKAEQQRMQKALSATVFYGSPKPGSAERIQIAGIEKGTKNRYKDMLPYDHSRVRLQNVSRGDCDYVNASHLGAEWSNKRYIASQAPVPATFEDFWRVVWEQDARVVVMLTAESEGGQRKCHPYWLQGEYGPFHLKLLSERRHSLDTPKPTSTGDFTPSEPSANIRPDLGRRHSTHHGSYVGNDKQNPPSPDLEIPHVIIRKLTLSHHSHPSHPLREITQLQYSSWPDFGAPAHPTQVLGLVQHCGAVVRSYEKGPGNTAKMPAKKGERPIVVHCSAGCGRTGTFCTVDSVVDMLKRQRMEGEKAKEEKGHERMNVDKQETERDGYGDWVLRDDVDLIAKTVEDFRHQRLSMVQTLRQFVLCYESVLEWLVIEETSHLPPTPSPVPLSTLKRPKMHSSASSSGPGSSERRSYHA